MEEKTEKQIETMIKQMVPGEYSVTVTRVAKTSNWVVSPAVWGSVADAERLSLEVATAGDTLRRTYRLREE